MKKPSKRKGHCTYAVVRTRDVLGYQEYFGPMISCPKDAARDAERLFGKPGQATEAVAWSACPAWIKKRLKLED